MPVLVSALLMLPQTLDVKMAFRGLLGYIHTSCIHRSVRPYGVSLSAFKGGVPPKLADEHGLGEWPATSNGGVPWKEVP